LREKNKKESSTQAKDRVLGDEWLSWKKSENLKFEKIDEGKSTFLIFFSIIIFIFLLGILFIFYLIIPRLREFHTILPYIIGVIIFAFCCFTIIEYTLFLIATYKERKIGFRLGKLTVSMNFLFPFAFTLAQKIGFSIDEFGNSFIKVHNAITHAIFKKDAGRKVLILLPRCLEKPLIKKIKEIGEKYKVDISVVGGGSKAKEVIKQKKPTAVIGIACERDLVSGIRDVSGNIPVIGVVNERPEGPCKQTIIDISKVEDAIKFFQKKQN